MKILIFILLFLSNLVLSVSFYILPERKFLVIVLLIFFSFLFFIYSYFVFFKSLYSFFTGFSKDKIKSLFVIIFACIFLFIFVIVFFKLPFLENIQKNSFDEKLFKQVQRVSSDFKFYYIKDEKTLVLKNYLDQINFEVIDSVFQASEYKDLCRLLGKNLKKGSLVIAYKNNYNVLSNVTYNNIALSIATLVNGKRNICVHGDNVKSIYNFNEDGLGIFSSIIEDSGFTVTEKNYDSCDLNLVFTINNLNLDKLINLILISKDIDVLDVKSRALIKVANRTKVDFNFYAQDLVTEFKGVFSNIEEEVIAGASYGLEATSSKELAFIDAEARYPVMIEKEGVLFISSENILSNLYMQNPGNQNFARFLIYSRFREYKKFLIDFKNEYQENFFTSYRFFIYIKIILFFISPLFIALFGITSFRKYRS